jgi:DNA-binding GntR family transcriptional regulator
MNLIKEPIYQQLVAILRQSVQGGEYKAGDQFLTEKSICETYRVSRATAGKALSVLVADGLLEFRKGIGTFVSSNESPYDLQNLVSFSVMAEQLQKKPDSRVMDFRCISGMEAGSEICRILRIGNNEKLYFCKRIRFLDGCPSLLDKRYIRESCCPGLSRKDMKGSFSRIWRGRYHLDVIGTDQTIQAVALTQRESMLLGLKEGECALKLHAVGILQSGEFLWYEESLFPGNQYVMRNRFVPHVGAQPVSREFIGDG